MLALVNRVLKAVFAGLGAGIGVLVGATVEADASWSAISVNSWLVAAGAFVTMFTTVYFVPNSSAPE